MKFILILALLFSGSQLLFANQFINIVDNQKISTRQKILQIRELIDESENREELIEQIFLQMSSWQIPPSIEAGDERANFLEWYPLAKSLTPYEEASPLAIKGVTHHVDEITAIICRALVLGQKRRYGIDASISIRAKIKTIEDPEEVEQLEMLLQSLAEVTVIPENLRTSLADEPPTIEELMLARKVERDAARHLELNEDRAVKDATTARKNGIQRIPKPLAGTNPQQPEQKSPWPYLLGFLVVLAVLIGGIKAWKA